MAELKHLKTFENFSQVENQEFELIDEGVTDFFSKIADKVGVKVEDFLHQWKNPKTVAWAKRMAKNYLKSGKLDQNAYDKAVKVNFDPEQSDSRDFFLQMAKIKGALSSAPMSATTKLLGNS